MTLKIILPSTVPEGSLDPRTLAACCAERLGAEVLLAPPLYHLSEDSPLWAEIAAGTGPLVVFSALHPRPTEWLLRHHACRSRPLVCLRLPSLPTCAAALQALREALPDLPVPVGEGAVREAALSVAERWYPVIDRSRCSQCRHCLQFCLFGVYAEDARGRVTVTQPDLCKPGCPACSRICPQGAIMFPLYAEDPAIAGAPGCYPTPDAAATRMFYRRTGARCPLCEREGPLPDRPAPGLPVCAECGRPTEASPAAAEDVAAELDGLLSDLDDLARRLR